MAKQKGNINITGSIDGICFYKMHGQYYARGKSSLTGKRVKTNDEFRLTMLYAGMLGSAAKIASHTYKALPKDFRRHWMYRAFTGEAMQWLKKGKTTGEVKKLLWKTYVQVWELKKAGRPYKPAAVLSLLPRVQKQKSRSVNNQRKKVLVTG